MKPGYCRSALLGGLVIVSAGCAGGGALRVGDVTPDAIPELEAQRSVDPDNNATLARLGVAYFRAERLPSARAALDSAVTRDPANGIAAVYLGMTAEAQGDFPAARTAYESYIATSRSRELRNTARARLSLLSRRHLEFEARQALAAEASRTQGPPEANTIAVMPFGYTGTNEELRPLSRGFAQLLITDLAQSRQVRVLERERMEAILGEMRITEEGRTSAETAARSGRLLAASRIVQGSLTDSDQDLRITATVVDAATSGVVPAASADGRLERLFDLQKTLVFQIFSNMGIQLTDAERAAIERRPTQNLQAFLAYSRGLEAEDRGDFQAAVQLFNQAARLDPGFQAAQTSSAQSSDLQTASTQSVSDVDVTATREEKVELGQAPAPETLREAMTNGVTNTTPSSTAVELTTSVSPPPLQRDPTAEGSGNDGPRPTVGRIRIVIPRP